MRSPALLWAVVAFAVAGAALVALVVVVALQDDGPPVGTDDASGRGDWIFRTGTAPDGTAIPRSGGMMMRRGCAGCHGADGRGRSTPMFTAPDITYANLTDPTGMLEPDGSRGHTYTDAELRRAVTEGVKPDGEALEWPMPRWRFSEEEWRDLLAYLKTLR
jgi:mono/diheme cytochrome c family protein